VLAACDRAPFRAEEHRAKYKARPRQGP